MSRSATHLLRRLTLTALAVASLTTANLVAQPVAAQAAPASPAHPATPARAPQAATAGHTATPTRAPQATAAHAPRAAYVPRTTPTARAARAARMRGYRIVAVAGAQRGKPYRFGARGPSAFDCSGLSGFAYRQVHLALPRTANDQYHAAKRISRSAARPGDLVFWVRGGHAYHVGIFAGNGRVWHAPKPGSRVKLARIFSAGEVHFGRIGI